MLEAGIGNAECPWDDFDSDAYLKQNYDEPHELDRRIIKQVAEFFGSIRRQATGWRGIDVGPGTNLYPALAMLPIADSIEFWERSAGNVAWLRNVLGPTGQPGGPPWSQFWRLLKESSRVYRQVTDPAAELKRKAVEPSKRNIFELPKNTWDVGTMFFVAESITELYDEFELATRKFLSALKPGAPFVAAFMENSFGYPVGDLHFPAVAITERDVRRALRGMVSMCKIQQVGAEKKFREGYGDVLLVTGQRGWFSDNSPRKRLVHASMPSYARTRPARAGRNR